MNDMEKSKPSKPRYPEFEEFISPNENLVINKEERWQKAIELTNNIVDGLGKPIDSGIKPVVIALLANKVPTTKSCEGHPHINNNTHGPSYPWVAISTPDPEGWRDNEEVQKKWKLENLQQQQRMLDYLTDFYKDRETTYGDQIRIDFGNIYGSFRIQSTSGAIMELLSPEEQQSKIAMYRKEMDDFAEFLKNKYFS